MHTNPFSAVGYDLADIRRDIQRKADSHELSTLRSEMDRLERSVRELNSENARLQRRCEILEESCQEMIREYRETNGQFGVGA